jgi:TP901 family phage tail tape measure protein
MADNSVKFVINIDGNAYKGIVQMDEAFSGLNVNVKSSMSLFDKLASFSLKFNMISDAVGRFQQALSDTIRPGIDFDSQLRELSAVTGVTGEGLDAIGSYARENAKVFGGSAADSLNSYKLLLSQLTPEIARTPEALQAMGKSVSVLSKAMGGDATAAAETLTTALNQFGVDMSDPIAASKTMADMMNVMAAAANVGSAELPQIKQALEQAGMSAKVAGVSFEEVNAAIQVLDKAGKKGSEGGIALRNVMNIVSRGRFMEKHALEGLQEAGVNIDVLSDKSLSLTERLRPLKAIMGDSALISKLFGMENQAAALALLNGLDVIDEYTEAVGGTSAAYEYADTVMESYAERQARIKAQFDDIKISLFNATGDMGIWVEVIAGSLVPLAQLIPLLAAMGKAFTFVKAQAIGAYTSIGMYNGYLAMGQVANLGFAKNVLQAAVALGRFAIVGIWNAVKGIGAFIMSLVTGGATSVAFSGIASAAFGAFATAASVACKAVTVAISSIPIIGWIAIAVTAIGALFVWLYKKFDGFRATINGVGAALKAIFTGKWGSIKSSFNSAYDETMREAKERAEEAEKDDPLAEIKKQTEELAKQDAEGNATNVDLTRTMNSTATIAAGDKKIKNINITIDRVIEKFTVQTTYLKDSTARIKSLVADAIIEGINDVNLAY